MPNTSYGAMRKPCAFTSRTWQNSHVEALLANFYGKTKSSKMSLGSNMQIYGFLLPSSSWSLKLPFAETPSYIFRWRSRFRRRRVCLSSLISRRGASWLGTFTSENLAYDFRRNTPTLGEFIGYADSTDFCESSPEHSRDNSEPKCVGKFWYLTYFSRGVHLHNTSCTFLATANLDMDI